MVLIMVVCVLLVPPKMEWQILVIMLLLTMKMKTYLLFWQKKMSK